MDAEIIVVDASRDDSARIAATFDKVSVIRREPGTLAPELWAIGIRASRGRVVALTTGHCIVERAWAPALVAALDSGLQGVAGGLELANETSVTDWAVFYLRYSEFMRESVGDKRPVQMIPADNAAYRGEDIRAYMANREDGFWEVDYHRVIHDRRTGDLGLIRTAVARFGRSFPLYTIAAHRFAHGRHFGAWRVANGMVPRGRAILRAPLVPFVLVARVYRRVWPHASHRARFTLAAPLFLILAGAWAAGEAFGAFAGMGRAHRRSEAIA
jgi:hypothetical protein